MNPKMILLERAKADIETKKKQLEEAKANYAAIEGMPDSLFEGLAFPSSGAVVGVKSSFKMFGGGNALPMPIIPTVKDTGTDYGKNKRTVIDILMNHGKAMLKHEIIHAFELSAGLEDASQVVTNALSALSNDGLVKGFKPENGVRFRGNYWGLMLWFDGEKIKQDFAPDPYDPLKRFSVQ